MKQGIAIPTYDVHKRCVWHVDNHVDVSNTLYMGCRRLIESNKREVGFAES
jgi:anaerobic ribonucleoside-triphosphate reductase